MLDRGLQTLFIRMRTLSVRYIWYQQVHTGSGLYHSFPSDTRRSVFQLQNISNNSTMPPVGSEHLAEELSNTNLYSGCYIGLTSYLEYLCYILPLADIY